MATPTKHARLAPSAAHRWLTCTMAPTFEDQFPSGSSVYAEEGTFAHAVCELYVKKAFKQVTPQKFGAEMRRLRQSDYFSQEVVACAEEYVNYLVEQSMAFSEEPYVGTEYGVDLSDYVPDAFGSCDCVMIGGDTLIVVDYKHGKGVEVSVDHNPQLMLYALGALSAFQPVFGDNIEKVRMAICQPRIKEAVEEFDLSVAELLDWGESIKPIAITAHTGIGAEFRTGEHCRFCRGKNACKARAERFVRLEPVQEIAALEDFMTADTDTLTDDDLRHILSTGQALSDWFSGIKDHVTQRLLAGETLEGYKLVEGRSVRAFVDTDRAMEAIIAGGYDRSVVYDYSPKSLAKLENTIGKKQFQELVGGMIVKPQGKPTLVPADDKRPEYVEATKEDFIQERN